MVAANIVTEEFWRSAKAELGRNSLQGSQCRLVVDCFSQLGQPATVHIHYAVHELHLVSVAGLDHFAQVFRARCAGLFADHVFAGFGSANNPLLSQTSRQGHIDRVNVWVSDQFLITSVSTGLRLDRPMSLAIMDKLLCRTLGAAGYRSNRTVPRISDRQPVFATNRRGAQNSPATDTNRHLS